MTCAFGHHSLLLDSRDHWADIIQDGRPPIVRCRCKSKRFALTLEYLFRPDGDIYQIDVVLHCSKCGAEKRPTTLEIDYSPTGTLLSSPLDPCEGPWVIPRRHSYTSFWKAADVDQALRLAGLEASRTWFAGWGETPRLIEVERASELALDALAREKTYNVLLSNADIDLTGIEPRACWKSLPLIQLHSPTIMNYSFEGTRVRAVLHYIDFAQEVLSGGTIVSQPAEFIDFAARVLRRFRAVFVSTRGPRTLDAADEFARLAPALEHRG